MKTAGRFGWRTRVEVQAAVLALVVGLAGAAALQAQPAPKPQAAAPEAKPETKPETKPEEKPAETPAETVLVLSRHGTVTVADNEFGIDDLAEVLPKLIENGMVRKDAPALVRADRRCNFRVVQSALQACKAAGIQNVRVAAGDDDSPPSPCVVLILADDLGIGDLGCYGSKDLQTPNIDRLARRGMRFTDFYAACSVCSPTRAALLSGRWPEAVGVPGVIRTHSGNSFGLLSPEAVLLPAALKGAGYRTAMVGKWHLGLAEPNLPNARGFDMFYGFLGDMMDDYWTHLRHGVNYMRLDRREIAPQGHATDLFCDWAAKWIKHYRGEEPFFLYLALNAPHDPVQPPDDYLARYKARNPQASDKRAKLAALIEHLDAGVGRVLEALHEAGWDEDTLVLFTSDNGGHLGLGADNGPWRDGKGSFYEGGLRVPMIARWPGRIQEDSTCGTVATSADLCATLYEAAGVSREGDPPRPGLLGAMARAVGGQTRGDAAGVSLLGILRGKTAELPQRDLFFVRRESFGVIEAMRRGQYKLVQPGPGKPFELFDLAADPKETTDLAAKQPDVFAEMKKALDQHRARYASVPWRNESGAGPGEIVGEGGKK